MKIRHNILTGALASTLAICALVPFQMGGCATDAGGLVGSVTGKPMPAGSDKLISAGQKAVAATTLGEAQEDALGQSVAISATNRYRLDPNESLNKYVTLVGLTVASASPRPDGNYVFGVLDSDEVNAFSGPNGYILITRGAILRMQDEAELAGVLAHEIAHIVNHDGLNAVKNAGYADAFAEAAKAADTRAAAFGQLTDGVVDVVMKKGYSRGQEFSADADAVKYLVAARYDPSSYLKYVKRLGATRSTGNPLMSTHPGLEERASKIAAAIGTRTGGATLKDRFDKNIPAK
jgi:predicted Zn-dependent protease